MPCPVLAGKVFTELLVVLFVFSESLELDGPSFGGLSIFCASTPPNSLLLLGIIVFSCYLRSIHFPRPILAESSVK